MTIDALTTRGGSGLDAIAPEDPEWVAAAHREFTITSWSVQSNVHPITITGGAGCWFWDADGKRYLDFQSQLVNLNLGHQHPRLVEAIKRQADKLCYIGPAMANDARSELAALIAEVTPGDLKSSFLTTGGAAANENAIRLARQYTGRNKIITRYRSYHGATAGAITLTGDPRRWPTEPGMPGVVRMFDPYTYRCPAGHPDPCPVCSGGPHLEELLMYENPDTVAAVLIEPVTGTNGLIYPPDGYLASLREVCDRHGILLIFDEVMSGFGRTGEWFACDHWNVAAGHPVRRQGAQLRLRAARGDGRVAADRRLARGPHVPRRDDVRRPPAGLRHRRRVDPCLPRGRHRRSRRSHGRPARRRCSPSSPSAIRRSATSAAAACSTASSWCATGTRVRRSCRSTPRALTPRR